ncbi:cysteine and glycine-rich protein 1 [Glomus cerebriforme]|uniref:Cysteine and glycine-rich protein 1 n=1 Tax=Glomus cerebriforme TaxID=658196 RepID=A0A397TC67_9GLOM|nr:cysteine and glycine-rich protein 1 [Glomus cerebriforme]
MSSRWGGTPQCPRCQKAVYMAEQVIGPNGPWHKACLTCIDCKKRLDSYALAEHEGEAYCKTCHIRRFGPKGYGYGAGASFLNTDRPIEKPSSNGSTSDKISQSPPKSPISPSVGFFSTRPQSPRSAKRSWTLPTSNDICPRCSKAVYAAEAALGAGVKYHKLCLRCVNCDKLVSSSNLADREGKIYCRPCYSKAFGPKGYGYGNGAAFLTTEGAAT